MKNATNGSVIDDGLDIQAFASETSKVLPKKIMINLSALHVASIAIDGGIFAS